MKRFLVVAIVAMVACSGLVYAADTTPVKLTLFTPVSVPSQKTVHGIDLGIISTHVDEVQGLQGAWAYGCIDNKLVGLQSAIVTHAGDATGVQWGFYNGADNIKGVQFGFINVAEQLNGVQVGLVNVIKKGAKLPVMVFVNANF